jgi:pimeloyl-ACP methyl ester carboxylesterase
MSLRVLYLHGLGSSGDSASASMLRQRLGDCEVIAPTYLPQDPNFDVEQYANQVDVVVGTSMGGYHALRLAGRLPVIVVNPCYDPAVMLTKYLDAPIPDHTGNGSHPPLTPEILAQFGTVDSDLLFKCRPTMDWIIGAQDQLISPKAQYAAALACGATIHWFPYVGHRMNGDVADRIEEIISDMM